MAEHHRSSASCQARDDINERERLMKIIGTWSEYLTQPFRGPDWRRVALRVVLDVGDMYNTDAFAGSDIQRFEEVGKSAKRLRDSFLRLTSFCEEARATICNFDAPRDPGEPRDGVSDLTQGAVRYIDEVEGRLDAALKKSGPRHNAQQLATINEARNKMSEILTYASIRTLTTNASLFVGPHLREAKTKADAALSHHAWSQFHRVSSCDVSSDVLEQARKTFDRAQEEVALAFAGSLKNTELDTIAGMLRDEQAVSRRSMTVGDLATIRAALQAAQAKMSQPR